MTDRGEGTQVWTVGHTNHGVHELLDLLGSHAVETIVDVRSKPGLRWIPRFNRENLEPDVRRHGLEYAWAGETLGGIPDDDRFYDEGGYVLYEPLAQEGWFVEAIDQLEEEATRARVALLCVEEEPERCHRHPLLGRVLVGQGVAVVHIRGDGSTESYTEVEHRLGHDQASLLAGEEVWRSPRPMRPG